jgi:DHA2 family multidrug resistance protein
LNPAYHAALNGMIHRLMQAGSNLVQATAQANQMIYASIQRQASMLAFLDNFKMLGVIFLVLIPLIMFMRKGKASGDVPVH